MKASPGGTYNDLAPLYDVAFSWDVAEEVDWLLARLGSDVRTILEPFCGSGRMFPEFARRGVEVVGVDLSETMLERARTRLRELGRPAPSLTCADVACFRIDRSLDGAICPINSFGHLPGDAAALSHLECVARSLRPGARYLVQIDLADSERPSFARESLDEPGPLSADAPWEAEQDGLRVRTTWGVLAWDAESRRQTEVARFEVLSGPRAGAVFEDRHAIRKWTWSEWLELVARSPFRLAGAFASTPGRPPAPLDGGLERMRLGWFELERRRSPKDPGLTLSPGRGAW